MLDNHGAGNLFVDEVTQERTPLDGVLILPSPATEEFVEVRSAPEEPVSLSSFGVDEVGRGVKLSFPVPITLLCQAVQFPPDENQVLDGRDPLVGIMLVAAINHITDDSSVLALGYEFKVAARVVSVAEDIVSHKCSILPV
jgi:hypothetical protein